MQSPSSEPRSAPTVLRGLVALMRPKQWIKNAFVFAPLLFAARFTEPAMQLMALKAAALFCLASSATYVVNDIHDVEHDRRHARKAKTRPLAAGIVSMPMALALLAALYALILAGCITMPAVGAVVAGYVVLNVGYTFVLKHHPVVDIFTIAVSFVLRVWAGSVAVGVPLGSWMAITTLCLALYLAAVKRRQELMQSGGKSRSVLDKYTLRLIDRYAEMSATGAIVFYSLFVMANKPQMAITIPVVLFGLFRYWYVVEALDGGESPTDVLIADLPLLATVLLWIGLCAYQLMPGTAPP